MAESDKLFEGTLTVGEEATPMEFSSTVTKVTVEPKVDDGDSIPVLDGSEVKDDGDETWALKGEFLQSYGVGALLTKVNTAYRAAVVGGNPQSVPFTLKPKDTGALSITGKIWLRPVVVGGDVKKRNTSEFEFPLDGFPVFTETGGV